MKLLKGFFTLLGVLVFFGLAFAFVKFDLGSKLSQVSQLDKNAMPEYMKMFDVVLKTGDPAKGMVRRVKMQIPEGMTKQEAFENAIEIADEVASEHGLAMVDNKTMPRGGKLFKDGGKLTHIRSYCSHTIADKFLNYSPYFVGFMPCRIAFVEDDNGDIYIYTMSLELMINGGKPLPKELLELANEVRSGMYEMIEKAAKGEDDD